MQPSSTLCRTQEALQRNRAASTSLVNVRALAEKRLTPGRGRALAEKREQRQTEIALSRN